MLNLHHIELFYYVARHGGISEAVRQIPYGIQQPAVSAQILQLEDSLGTKLFERRPFKLTPAGHKLYSFIEPFLGNIERIGDEIRGTANRFIRLGASGTVLRHHFPEVLRSLRKKMPGLKVSMHEGIEPQLLDWLRRQEIDLAITVLDGRIPAGIDSHQIIRLPLALLVPKDSRIKSADDLWKADKIEETLISMSPTEAVARHFQMGLLKLSVDWIPSHVVNSLNLVETYVASGFGIGVGVEVPGVKTDPAVRRIVLKDFEPVSIGVIWSGPRSELINAIIREFEAMVRQLGSAKP